MRHFVKLVAALVGGVALALFVHVSVTHLGAQPAPPFPAALAPPSFNQFALRVDPTTTPNRVVIGCETDTLGSLTVNGLRITGGATTVRPSITAVPCTGGDVNIGINLVAAGTGTVLVSGSAGLLIAQGTITAAAPALASTATWNAGGVTFTHWDANVTDTASAAGSLLATLRVNAVSQWQVDKVGSTTQLGAVTLGATSVLRWGATQSRMFSDADGRLKMTDSGNVSFNRLTLGGEAVSQPALIVAAAVAGETQGIILGKGDGTFAVFANLGAATNGSMIYCADCTIASPCAGAGTGAIAKRLNGAWVCN